jgi:hypothetical protein
MMMQPLVMAVLVSQHRADLMRRAEHARVVQDGRGTPLRVGFRGLGRRRRLFVPAVTLRPRGVVSANPADVATAICAARA